MSYVVGNADVIKDPYVIEELQRLQAYLKGLAQQIGVQEEQPDDPVSTPGPPGPTGPGGKDGKSGSGTNAAVGQQWVTGPWAIGIDGAGVPKNIPSYAVCQPPELSTSQDNFAPDGIDSAIILELGQSATPLNITGIRIGGRTVSTGYAGAGTFQIYPRRMLGILNRGGGTINLVNESSSSAAQNRFSWGGSGDVGESVAITAGQTVWLVYDPRTERWRLFGVPAVGGDNLPDSLIPTAAAFPPDYMWCASRVIDGATLAGVGQGTPLQTFDTAAAVNGTIGFGRRLNTSLVIGNGAGLRGAQPNTMAQCDPSWTYILQTGASIANVRIWVVFSNGATSDADDLGALSYFGFRFSTVAGDTGWMGITKDGATQSLTAEVAAIAADTIYKLKIRKSGSTMYFSVNDGTEVSKTTNLPAATSQLTWYAFVYTQAAALKSLVHFHEHLKHSVTA